jgi:hypothetical protein
MSDTPQFDEQAAKDRLGVAEVKLRDSRKERDDLNRKIVDELVPAVALAKGLLRQFHPIKRQRKPKQAVLIEEGGA